jgi:hypothetical protein
MRRLQLVVVLANAWVLSIGLTSGPIALPPLCDYRGRS